MSEEMQIDGRSFISSKRAAELSGYAQDYIGQLARKSLIEARRIGGLWYVSMDSLTSYKKKADEYKPTPPARIESPDTGSLVFFDGKEYLSAARAAEQTGYAQDYVGQLARSGNIQSRQVGNRWYVEKESIVSHKKEKDGLLAAVQTQSVGLSKPAEPEASLQQPAKATAEPLLNYFSESADLLPAISDYPKKVDEYIDTKPHSGQTEVAQAVTPLPIKKLATAKPLISSVRKPAPMRPQPIRVAAVPRPQNSMLPMVIGAAATIVIVLSVGYVSLFKQNSAYATGKITSTAMPASVNAAFNTIGDLLEPLLTHELSYTRSN